jgi:hypothetical protein
MPQADVLRMLSQSAGWSIYKEMIEKKIQDAYDIIKSKQLVDQESVSRHNVSIGKIQAWQEMLDIAEPK